MVNSEESVSYVRRRSLEGSQRYAEALKAHEGDIITVRLATGIRVTVSKAPLNLGVKFLDFDSIERCLVLDLESRYDLILEMAWLESHEPGIDWRSKTLGATCTVLRGALESHEPTSASKQKRYWREPLTDSVSVLDIGMSELVESDDVKDISREQGSWTVSETARTPLSDTRCDNESLNAGSIVGQRSSHQGLCPADGRGVASKYSLSDIDGDVNALNIANDIVDNLSKHPGHT